MLGRVNCIRLMNLSQYRGLCVGTIHETKSIDLDKKKIPFDIVKLFVIITNKFLVS